MEQELKFHEISFYKSWVKLGAPFVSADSQAVGPEAYNYPSNFALLNLIFNFWDLTIPTSPTEA